MSRINLTHYGRQRFISNPAIFQVSQFLHYKTPEDDEIEKVKKELQEGRQQLGSLSSTDQFAAYFKAERLVNRLNDQYQQLGKLLFQK